MNVFSLVDLWMVDVQDVVGKCFKRKSIDVSDDTNVLLRSSGVCGVIGMWRHWNQDCVVRIRCMRILMECLGCWIVQKARNLWTFYLHD